LVSGRVEVFGDECADRERGLDLPVVRADERVDTLDFDLDLVMGSSEVMRRHPPHHPSPRPGAITPAGQDPEARIRHFKSHDSNAPINPVSQSNLSNIIALFDSNHGLHTVRIAFPLGRYLLLSAPQRGRALSTSGHVNETRRALFRLMNMDQASGPRMPRIKKLVLRDPVGVPSSCCTTTSERIDHWTKMRRSLARFSRQEASNRIPSLVDFITITPGFRLSVHTGSYYLIPVFIRTFHTDVL